MSDASLPHAFPCSTVFKAIDFDIGVKIIKRLTGSDRASTKTQHKASNCETLGAEAESGTEDEDEIFQEAKEYLTDSHFPSGGCNDMLTYCPQEVIEIILSFLINAGSGSTTATGRHYLDFDGPGKSLCETHRRHPFRALAQTNKRLNTIVDSYCQCLVEKFKKSIQHQMTPGWNDTMYRRRWLLCIRLRCIFCGLFSGRSAIFQTSAFCCRSCDERCFPPKITKTDAMKRYRLSIHDLLDPARLYGTNCGLKPLVHASVVYPWRGVYFWKGDVQQRAAVVWGELYQEEGVRRLRKDEKMEYLASGKQLGLKGRLMWFT